MLQESQTVGLDLLVGHLRAAGEETRLRLLALIAEGELSVSDLTDILGQSQPRISRHLKLMAEAGLIERNREGSWAFFRIAERHPAGALARLLVSRLDPRDGVIGADRARLAAVRQARAAAAKTYFDRHAAEWDRIRSLHAPDAMVETAILDMLGSGPLGAVLDLGTGTGRILTLLAAQATRLVGVDSNQAKLAVARATLETAGLRQAELRQGDIYALPIERGSYDLVVVHQVLHFLDDPARARREAAAALAPGGRLLVVDFAPHGLDFLREAHAHRRLGFDRGQIEDWLDAAGLDTARHLLLPAPAAGSDQLTVSLWLGRDRRAPLSVRSASPQQEVA